MLPATRALAAALALMAPLAVLLMVAFALAESRGLYMVYSFSTGASCGCRCTRLLCSVLCPAPCALHLHLSRLQTQPARLPSSDSAPAARLLGSLCGTPLLLWPAAVALTAYPPFRDAHMPAPPTEEQLPGEQKAEAAAPPPASTEDHEPPAAQQAAEQKLKAAEEEGAEALPAGAKKEQ